MESEKEFLSLILRGAFLVLFFLNSLHFWKFIKTEVLGIIYRLSNRRDFA